MTTLLDHAIVACEQAVKADSQVTEACRVLGSLLQGMGRFEEAVYWHTRAFDPQGSQVEVLAALGRLYAQQQQWSEAIALYQQVLQFEPESAEAYWSLANIYTELQNEAEAIRCRQQAFQINPDWATPVNQLELGNQLLQQNQVSAAIACYGKALQLQPRFLEACFNLAIAQTIANDWDEAIASYHQVLQLDPTHVKARVHLAQLLEQQGDWQAAIDCYQAAVQEGQSGDLYYAAGNLCFRQGLYAEAISMFEAAIQADPFQVWSYHQWIESHIRQQQWDEAIQVCQLALAAGHTSPWLYTYWGRILTLQGKTTESIQWYQKGCAGRGWQQCQDRDYQFTEDWFSHHIPIWQVLLQPIAHAAGLRFLEIGSYQGMSACWLLDQVLTHPTTHLTCIDPNFQVLFQKNIDKTGSADRVDRLMGNSHALLATLKAVDFDLIYIDGCHLADHVKRDAELAWLLLKPGGLMIFGNYEWQDPAFPGQDPKIGIDAFQQQQTQMTILHQGAQLILRKESAEP